MGITVGLDIGGSTTKIVALRDRNVNSRELVVATDPVTSAYGAVGKLLNDNRLPLSSIDQIKVTGVGAAHVRDGLFGIPTHMFRIRCSRARGAVPVRVGGAVIVSNGTGTAIVLADRRGSTLIVTSV
jgi:type II pantothenate kinase